jgi:hypothetical protein
MHNDFVPKKEASPVDDDIKLLLLKMVETIELLSDETATLLDKHLRSELAKEYWQVAVDRSNAIAESADNMRLIADKVLGKTDRSVELRRRTL